MRSHFFLFGIILGSLLALPTAAWTTDLSVTSGDYTIPLVIGVSDAGTEDFDPALDIPLPPVSPGATFNAYLAGTGLFPMLQTDIRETPEWRLYVDADEPILITWKAAPIPLMITIDGSTYPMDIPDDATLPPGRYRLLIQPFEEYEDVLPESITDDLFPGDVEDFVPYQVTQKSDQVGRTTSGEQGKTLAEPIPAESALSTPVPAPAESGVSFMPMLGGLISAFCAVCFYQRRRDP